jgi:hypothetical protein
MNNGKLGWLFACVALLLVAGCGGSSGGTGGGGNQNPTTVTVTFQGTAPALVATQIGTGSYSAATLTNQAISLTVPYGTSNFAVAYLCPAWQNGGGLEENDQWVLEASTKDGTSFTLHCAAGYSGSTGTLTGTVNSSAVATSSDSFVQISADNGTWLGGQNISVPTGSFNFQAPAGTDRASAVLYNPLMVNSQEVGIFAAAVQNFPSQAVPGQLNGGTVAFTSADATTTEPITYSNVPAGFSAPATVATYMWAGGGSFLLGNELASTYPVVPAAAVESGDSYFFQSFTGQYSANVSSGVSVYTLSTSSQPLAVSFPSPWSYAGPTAAASPTFNISYTGFSNASYVDSAALINWQPDSTSISYSAVIATENYLGGLSTLAYPALSAVTGFLPAPVSGKTVNWNVEVASFPSASVENAGSVTSNGSRTIVGNSGSFTVP